MQNTYWQPYSDRAIRRRRLIPDIDVTLSVMPGLKMKASLKKHLYICRPSTRRREVRIAQQLAELAPADGVIYDIGANIGLYSIVFAANRKRRVYAFEPYDRALSYLRQNLDLNNLHNVHTCPVLLSDKVGSCRFTYDSLTLYTSHISAEGEPGVELPCTDLDSYVERMNMPLPDVVKLDIEGADEAVLAGMRKLLRQRRAHIFLEGGLRDSEGRITAIDYLKDFGYSIWNLDLTHQLDSQTPEYMFVAAPS
ncbi:MAG TPA: FkbM family methyltransferase [Pyrinomonadaceae bacterium]|nr:FkbM family methyltransferase [Pyrinomonadaceae bacterium]